MSFNATEFVEISFIAALAIVSPGPGFALVVRNSLMHGQYVGTLIALGIALGDVSLCLINSIGLGLVLTKIPYSVTLMRFLGGGYLIFLGIKGITSSPQQITTNIQVETPLSMGSYMARGFVVTLFNPKAFLFLMALFSLVISVETPLAHKIGYSFWISLISLSWFSIVALFLGDNERRQKFYRYHHWIDRVTGLVLIGCAVSIFWSIDLK